MELLFLYVITFLVIYLFYYCFVLKRKRILENFKKSKELLYLQYKYKIKINGSNLKEIANKTFIVNAFIMSTTILIISFFKSFVLKIIVGAILCPIFIILFYHLLGKYYQKKQEVKKNV